MRKSDSIASILGLAECHIRFVENCFNSNYSMPSPVTIVLNLNLMTLTEPQQIE